MVDLKRPIHRCENGLDDRSQRRVVSQFEDITQRRNRLSGEEDGECRACPRFLSQNV